MKKFTKDFLELSINKGILRFGEFTLKSGRVSPYFFNAGLFNTGETLSQLGKCYAQLIHESGIEFDILFGPSYKGIPLAAATAVALADLYGIDTPYAYNRKEAKDHGEGGLIVGAELRGKILVIDDVISAGTSIKESADIISNNGGQICGVVIALDRQERGSGELSAVQEIENSYGVNVNSIATLNNLISLLQDEESLSETDSSIHEKMVAYREQYGISDN